jgi:hypothetical protein
MASTASASRSSKTTDSFQRAAIERYFGTLPETAPMRLIVASPAVQEQLAIYEMTDAAALAAQARFRAWGRRGLTATTFGILIGALLLFPLGSLVAGKPRVVIGALQTFALLMTFDATLLITWLKPLDQWMSNRAEAEQHRGKIFAIILSSSGPTPADSKALAAEKLDLLMAAHIDDQLRFFDRRAREHRKVASKFSPLRLLGYLLIICASVIGLATLLKGLDIALPATISRLVAFIAVSDANRWQLGMTTMASGILAHATARTLMEEDERKAALYKVTAVKLRKLIESDFPKVQASAASGDEAMLRTFFAQARGIMEQEHAVWSLVRP